MIPREGRIDFPGPGIDAAAKAFHVFKTVPGEIGGSVHAPRAIMIDEDHEPHAVPLHQHLLHQLLRKMDRAVDMHRVEFLARPDVHQLRRVAPRGELGGRELGERVLLLAAVQISDDFVRRELRVALTHFGQCLCRLEAAARTAADVIFAKKGALSPGIDREQVAHGGLWRDFGSR